MSFPHILRRRPQGIVIRVLPLFFVGLLLLAFSGCLQEYAQESADKAFVTFSNATGAPVEIYWVDDQGEEQSDGILSPGAGDDFNTHDSEIWHFKQGDQLIGTYKAGNDPRQFHIIKVMNEDEIAQAVSVDPSAAPQMKSLRATDFAPDYHHPAIQFLPDGFILPNQPVSLWSKKELYNLDTSSEFILEFDALFTTAQQEIIVAFSQNKIPWGGEGADALTIRMSPADQDIWLRTGFFEGWLDIQLYYNSSEKVFSIDQTQRYEIRFTPSNVAISVDGREIAGASLDDGGLDAADFPRRGSVGFVVFGQEESGDATITYQNIAVGETAAQLAAAPPSEGERSRDFVVVEPTNPTAVSLSAAGRYYALVIGVQDYIDAAINDLDFPIQDAENIVQTLTSTYTFDPQDVTLLKNPKKADILNEMDRLRTQVKPEDNLLIFYAGHGFWDERMEQGFWLPTDAEKGFRANWLSNGTLRDYLRAIKSQHTLLVSDACFSGGIFKTRGAFTADRATEELYKLPSRRAITSGTLTEVPDKSVFIRYLIKRLQDNDQSFLTTQRLFNSVRDPVINNSNQIPQFGVVQETGDEGGEFVFRRRGPS